MQAPGSGDAGAEQIPTAPTELEAILERVSEIDIQAFVQRADNTVRALESLLTDPEVKRLPASLNATLAEVRTLAADTDRDFIMDPLQSVEYGIIDQVIAKREKEKV